MWEAGFDSLWDRRWLQIYKNRSMKSRIFLGILLVILGLFGFSLFVAFNFFEGRCPEHFVWPKKEWYKCSFWDAYKFIIIEDVYTGWSPAIYWYPPKWLLGISSPELKDDRFFNESLHFIPNVEWARSSLGRASLWRREGTRFESWRAHSAFEIINDLGASVSLT